MARAMMQKLFARHCFAVRIHDTRLNQKRFLNLSMMQSTPEGLIVGRPIRASVEDFSLSEEFAFSVENVGDQLEMEVWIRHHESNEARARYTNLRVDSKVTSLLFDLNVAETGYATERVLLKAEIVGGAIIESKHFPEELRHWGRRVRPQDLTEVGQYTGVLDESNPVHPDADLFTFRITENAGEPPTYTVSFDISGVSYPSTGVYALDTALEHTRLVCGKYESTGTDREELVHSMMGLVMMRTGRRIVGFVRDRDDAPRLETTAAERPPVVPDRPGVYTGHLHSIDGGSEGNTFRLFINKKLDGRYTVQLNLRGVDLALTGCKELDQSLRAAAKHLDDHVQVIGPNLPELVRGVIRHVMLKTGRGIAKFTYDGEHLPVGDLTTQT